MSNPTAKTHFQIVGEFLERNLQGSTPRVKFHHVEPTLAPLNLADGGLSRSKPLRQFNLREPRAGPRIVEVLKKHRVLSRMDRFSHNFRHFIFDFRIVQDRIMPVNEIRQAAPEVKAMNKSLPAFFMNPVSMSKADAASPAKAFQSLASVAMKCLLELDLNARVGTVAARAAFTSCIRGRGPGVSFGHIVDTLRSASVGWICPFEGCMTARGSVLRGCDLVSPERNDAFLVLHFEPHTLDLPLHIHEDSDRFIYIIEGRGFYHCSPDPLEAGKSRQLRHIAVRDRDVVMFRRGTVHTFSTAEHPLTVLSYHRPYVSLADERQYTLTSDVERPADFLRSHVASISIGQAWASV